jgi:hypothetical protein
MKAIMLVTGGGALVVLTSYDVPTAPGLLAKLESKGIEKFIAHEIPLDLARERYGAHFSVVANDLHESDDLRVLDYNGDRAFKLFGFAELGPVVEYESDRIRDERVERARTAAAAATVRGAEDLQ